MKFKTMVAFLLVSFFIVSSASYSQEVIENPEEKTEEPEEKTENDDPKWNDFEDEDEFEGEGEEWNDFNYWSSSSSFSTIDHPTIEVVYGMIKPSIHESEFDGSFNTVGALELRLGYTDISEHFFSSDICEYDYSYFTISNISEEINKEDADDPQRIGTDVWKFGFAWSNGYGYNLAEGYNVILFHTNGMNWSKLDFRGEAPNQKSKAAMHAYGDAVRFGTMTESGLKIHLFDYIAVSGAYERSVVFPRHLFWYWTTSEIVGAIGHGLVSAFIDDIIEASPYAGPIAYFVLNTGISYGMYELRKENMNWPIDTHAPFFNEGFKVSFSFLF